MRELLKKFIFSLNRGELARLRQYKNCFAGEACYIFGDGVSLKWFDLSVFADRPSFVCSMIPFHPQFDELQTEFCLLAEPWWFYPQIITDKIIADASMPDISNFYKRHIIPRNCDKKFVVNLSNKPMIRGPNIFFVFKELIDSDLFSFLTKHGVDGLSGSIRMSITLAIYCGFEHITLVGCDYTHGSSRSRHWYEQGEGVIYPQPNYQKIFFELITTFGGVSLNTVTLDGCSSILPALKYETTTGRKLEYRENHELLSQDMLNILDSWHEYRVFHQ